MLLDPRKARFFVALPDPQARATDLVSGAGLRVAFIVKTAVDERRGGRGLRDARDSPAG